MRSEPTLHVGTSERVAEANDSGAQLFDDPATASRRWFLTATIATAALGVVAGCQDEDEPPTAVDDDNSDLEIVRFALRLERVEEAFYDAVLTKGVLTGKGLSLARTFHDHEREHVEALEDLLRRLGGRSEPRLRTEFPIDDERQVLELASKLEDLGADAYLAQLGRLRRQSVIDEAVGIYAVETRHAGALNALAGDADYTPSGPFAKPLAMREALEELDPYIQ